MAPLGFLFLDILPVRHKSNDLRGMNGDPQKKGSTGY
jgi:hypothetical protein